MKFAFLLYRIFVLISVTAVASVLSSCSIVSYQPLETIDHIDPNHGYRSGSNVVNAHDDQNMIFLLFSGGGTRAAALGYGVLENFSRQHVKPTPSGDTLLDNIDVVSGVSGGSVLAAYFSLNGRETIPRFDDEFLKHNFQRELIGQIFSLSNMPKLLSAQYGRGDLLQERLNFTLFKDATFGDLALYRKGPFALISATDMVQGNKIVFTQEAFDGLCLNLSKLPIARAVAASSSVPLIFSPLTLNNNGGNCGFTLPESFSDERKSYMHRYNIKDVKNLINSYQDSAARPYIHMVDGGLNDNLGLTNLLDIYDALGKERLTAIIDKYQKLKRIVVISVNAQNAVSSDIDMSADIPGTAAVVNSIINVPIDQNSRVSLFRFRHLVDDWNAEMYKKPAANRVMVHFVSLNLKDLPDSELKKRALNIETSFFLNSEEIDLLKQAANILLENSSEFQNLIAELNE
ncbi:MAG: patatin-like phospholipase family protein [Succinivibrionaceae bacterium]|nr:patatin-like phospholipase family protein [Succinivibrionaceae bacterium]